MLRPLHRKVWRTSGRIDHARIKRQRHRLGDDNSSQLLHLAIPSNALTVGQPEQRLGERVLCCDRQVQQIASHKNDFPLATSALGIAFIWALAALFRAAWGDSHNAQAHLLLCVCAIYVGVSGYSLARYAWSPVSR